MGVQEFFGGLKAACVQGWEEDLYNKAVDKKVAQIKAKVRTKAAVKVQSSTVSEGQKRKDKALEDRPELVEQEKNRLAAAARRQATSSRSVARKALWASDPEQAAQDKEAKQGLWS